MDAAPLDLSGLRKTRRPSAESYFRADRTITATAEMASLHVLIYLTAYLDACGHNGKPLASPELGAFLPWNAAPADLRAWAQPPRPG